MNLLTSGKLNGYLPEKQAEDMFFRLKNYSSDSHHYT